MTDQSSRTTTRQAHETRCQALLKEHAASGLSLKRFAATKGIPYTTLISWRKKERDRETTPPSPQLLPVRMVDPAVDSAFDLSLPGGRTLRIPSRFCPDALDRLLAVLDSRC